MRVPEVKLWLVRHARPLVEPGVCYGALDVPADAQATQLAAQALANVLPDGVQLITSPLQRCIQLADALQTLRPAMVCSVDGRLAEMDFGVWEGQRWDAIPRTELDAWIQAFGSWRCGGAENVQDFMVRVAAVWDECRTQQQSVVWITHAGVVRAATLLHQGQRMINDANKWPITVPGWGEWTVSEP